MPSPFSPLSSVSDNRRGFVQSLPLRNTGHLASSWNTGKRPRFEKIVWSRSAYFRLVSSQEQTFVLYRMALLLSIVSFKGRVSRCRIVRSSSKFGVSRRLIVTSKLPIEDAANLYRPSSMMSRRLEVSQTQRSCPGPCTGPGPRPFLVASFKCDRWE
ncbi:hypothetical protein FB45DRAFT_891473 [Roridomyces roridus]|uniref:Uncharacterized protein n=1 Tax=Roridomyces roridus TaxID=1738132 RepID=A0AAD7CEA3_9AGAR|nr:hypothetical protein FB45DRAFT_891473 [Roridomyces roridus]